MKNVGGFVLSGRNKTHRVLKLYLCLIFTAVFVFTGVISSCGKNTVAVSSGNISNYGYVLVDKDDIYYTKTIINGAMFYSNIYKYNIKSGTEILVASTEADYYNEMNAFLSIDNGELYFLANFLDGSYKECSPNISKVKPDGKKIKPEKILDEDISCAFMQVINGVIYYYDDVEHGLYKINIDGTKKQLLCEAAISGIAISGDKIYFAEFEMLMEVSTDGGEPKEIYDFGEENFYIESLVFEGDYLYYLDDSLSFIGRIRTDGKDKSIIYRVGDDLPVYIDYFNVSGGTVYFVLDEYGPTGNYAVLSIVPGNRLAKVVVSDSEDFGDISALSVWGEKIYFFGMPISETIMDSDYVWFTVNKSGGKPEAFKPLSEDSETFGGDF